MKNLTNIQRSTSSSSPDSPSLRTPSSSSYNAQSLSSILNNPISSSSDATWLSNLIWLSSSSSYYSPDFLAPLTIKHTVSDVRRSDFEPYVNGIADAYSRFEDVRNHANREGDGAGGDAYLEDGEEARSGEALAACLREVPSLYFDPKFALEEGETFRAALASGSSQKSVPGASRYVTNMPGEEGSLGDVAGLQERLSHYLDTVEVHLVKEISLRSSSFFEAQGQLEGLNVEIVEACKRIRELREGIRELKLGGLAKEIQELNGTRTNLLVLQGKLRIMDYVSQALSALKLLVASGDCAGALDVTDDLQSLLDSDELAGLHCFRHLRDQLATSIDSVNSILSAEFMRASIHKAKDVDSAILSRLKTRATSVTNGKDDDVNLEVDEALSFRDRLLPLIVGLLRTAKLPSVLRIYRDTLIADMKSAIKTTVAELLPVLVAPVLLSDLMARERTGDADGGGLASKLRNLSSESFVRLLDAIFKVVQAHLVRAAEVKKAIEWIMSNLNGCYAADSGTEALSIGEVVAETGQVSSPYSVQKNTSKVNSFQGKGSDASSPSYMARNFRADVLRENTEAVCASCDAAHGRWAKLLGVRALLHPKLRLQEFLSIYNITQEFITATEKIGGRLGYSIRGTLQSQSKAFIDFQHESRMAKIKAVLDQETWAQVDIPDEFQTIVNSLSSTSLKVNETSYSDVVSINNGSLAVEASVFQDHIGENSIIRAEVVGSSAQNGDINMKEHVKSASQSLVLGDVGYHMVNSGLILLKMLAEYVDMNKSLPPLSSELVHRVVEILKLFNTRTCQLVLGAGAMQVSGLKSITSKHLALASQVISFIYAIIPAIKQTLFLRIPESRKALLLSELDRVAQDYKIHRDEIHSKLVQIMRERLLMHLRGLPQTVESWNRPEDNDTQPSQFVRSLTKEVGFLQRVLSRTLHEVDVQAIFRQVVQIFHFQISEAYSNLDITTPQAKNRLHRDIQSILACIRSLPTDIISDDGVPNSGQLDAFLLHMFGTEAGQ